MQEAGEQQSVSGLLLWTGGALALALLLAFIPLRILIQEGWPADTLKQAYVLVGAGALVWAALLWAAARAWRLSMASNKLKGTWVLPEHESGLAAARQLLGESTLQEIEIRIRGTLEGLEDTGRAFHATPEAVPTQNRGIIILPALFWVRFRPHARALAAVLAHEAAHLRNRDVILLTDLRRFMFGAAGISLLTAALSFAVSVRADLGSGSLHELRLALQAAVAGKNFFIVSLALLFVVWLLTRRMEYWREALADNQAIRQAGEEGLRHAENLLSGTGSQLPVDVHGQRPRRMDAARALTLTFREAVLLGFVSAAVAEYAAGPLSYIGEFLLTGRPAASVLLNAATFVHSAVLSTLAFIAARTYADDARRREQPLLKPVIHACFSLFIGALACRLLIQVLPASLTVFFMPSGFDAPSLHEPRRLLLAGLVGGAISHADALLMGAAAAVLSVTGLSRSLSLLPVLAWCALSTAEAQFFPALAQGAIAPLASGTLWLAFLPWPWRARARLGGASSTLVPLVGLSLAGWLGLAESNHLGDCAATTGAQRLAMGDASGALEPLRRATFLLRFQARGWSLLAAALAQSPGRLPDAADAAEQAASAPYASDWRVMLDGYASAGALRLQLGAPADLARAEEHLRGALRLWRSNNRLSKERAATALYNLACVKLRRGALLEDAAVDLIEAVILQPSLSLEALADSDLAPLGIAGQPSPNQAALLKLQGLKLEDGESLREAYQKESLKPGDVLALAGTIVKNTARMTLGEKAPAQRATAPQR